MGASLVLASIRIPGSISTCSPAIAMLARTRKDETTPAEQFGSEHKAVAA